MVTATVLSESTWKYRIHPKMILLLHHWPLFMLHIKQFSVINFSSESVFILIIVIFSTNRMAADMHTEMSAVTTAGLKSISFFKKITEAG